MTHTETIDIPVKGAKGRKRDYYATDKGRASKTRERKQYRKTEKGKARRTKDRKQWRRNNWERRPFIAWDGEGVTREDGRHDYLLLADSRGNVLQSLDRLSTESIFRFLIEQNQKGTINVIYGASYDWNMWIQDLDIDSLQELYETGTVRWHGWRIRWRQGKSFHLIRGKRSILFYDVVSFFQCPFVKACDSYLGDRFTDRDMIVENKMLRSTFRPDDLAEIARYNRAELVNLVALMEEFRARLVAVDLRPGRWDGPGAIAVALMKREGVKEHVNQSDAHQIPAVRSAYFGGRFEVIKAGHVEEPAYEYDVNSAYPWALQDVPSVEGGRWRYVKGDPGFHPYALYRIEYHSATDAAFPQPLPCRYDNGAVAFPHHVTGWYWSPEYDAVQKYVERWGGEYTIHEAYVFEPARDDKPFAFVPRLYEQRAALKRAKNGAHVGIKLGLNSLYGKCAQQVGWTVDEYGELRIPPYHQLDWAGYITSRCRAHVLLAALDNLEHVIAWETDAMFSTVPLDLPVSERLGEWGLTEFTSLTYLQSGTYFGTEDGEEIERTRGVDRGTLTRADALVAIQRGDEYVEASLTRFTTLGAALQGRFEHWARWETAPKRVQLAPNGKRMHITCHACRKGKFAVGEWHACVPALWAHGHRESVEYQVEWINPGSMSDDLSAMRAGHYESERYEDA